MPSAPKHSEGPFKKTIRVDDGLDLVGEVRGQGGTALVFLHGWCGDREYWKHQVEVFAADYRVVAIDQAGHGGQGAQGVDRRRPGRRCRGGGQGAGAASGVIFRRIEPDALVSGLHQLRDGFTRSHVDLLWVDSNSVMAARYHP
jgi:pimeloyl-ACP methyl ester carboxylesterase